MRAFCSHGRERAPTFEPIALLAHQDVVPIAAGTENDWEHPAFDGFDDGEFIWGRGALDMKNHLIAVIQTVETLLGEGFKPERTVYLCFGHNEEIVASANSGAGSIAAVLEERGVKLDSVIDEGGAILNVDVPKILRTKLAGIGIAEKGYADYKITVRSKGGHSSQPPVHSGIGEIAKVTRDLEGHQFKAKMPHFVYALFTKIGKRVSYPARIVTCNLWLLKPYSYPCYEKNSRLTASLIRTTTGVSMAEGSPCRQRSSAEEQHNGKLPYDAGNHSCGRKRAHQKCCKEKGYRNRIAQGQRGVKGLSYGQPLLQNS